MGTIFEVAGVSRNGEKTRIEVDGGGTLPNFVPLIIGRGAKRFGQGQADRGSTGVVLLFYSKRLDLQRVRAGLVVRRNRHLTMTDSVTFILQDGMWEQPRSPWSSQPLCVQRL